MYVSPPTFVPDLSWPPFPLLPPLPLPSQLSHSSPLLLSFYLEEGFLHLQNMVSSAIVKWKANQTGGCSEDLEIAVKEMPYPSYRIDNFLEWNSAILPLLLIMAFIYSAGMFTKVRLCGTCMYMYMYVHALALHIKIKADSRHLYSYANTHPMQVT